MIIVENRIKLLEHLPQNAICAEIGVSIGNFAQKILDLTNPQILFLIDEWKNLQHFQVVQERFKDQIKNKIVYPTKGKSEKILQEFPDHYLDWVYIDADHRYEKVLKDLEICSKKVKNDGFISGHDYVLNSSTVRFETGVALAVYEFCDKYDWKMTHITKDELPSFILQKQ